MNGPMEEVLTGVARDITPEDEMWMETARESYKKSGERLQDYLQKLVTLAVALAGGGMLAARDDLMGVNFRAGAVALFLVAAALAFWGSLPVSAKFNLDWVSHCRDFETRVIRVKHRWLWLAGLVLLFGMLVGLAGMVLKSPPAA